MTYKITEEDNISTIFLDGEIDMDKTDEVKGAIFPVIDSGKNVALNLSNVQYMDSSGISVLIESHQKATELGVTQFLPVIFDRTIVRKINKERLEKIEAIQSINDCLTRYCRALDWIDEDLLRSCFIEDGFIDYGFYAGDAKGFIPAVMEVEKGGHSWHLISNVAIEINGDKAEVESYGLTSGGEITEAGIQDVNVYCGRYHDEFSKTPEGWKVSRRLYILDDNFSVKSEGIRGDLGGLFLGFNLRADNEKYRKLDK